VTVVTVSNRSSLVPGYDTEREHSAGLLSFGDRSPSARNRGGEFRLASEMPGVGRATPVRGWRRRPSRARQRGWDNEIYARRVLSSIVAKVAPNPSASATIVAVAACIALFALFVYAVNKRR
jgi:hypothetical protein